jgi:predicted DNA-binding WGR domain protein
MPGEWMFPPAFRYFECVVPAANTEKFWCFKLAPAAPTAAPGMIVTTWWGRIGTRGSEDPEAFASPTAAQRKVEAKVVEKLRKGYVERDVEWVKRMWPEWRPPFAVDFKPYPRGEELRQLQKEITKTREKARPIERARPTFGRYIDPGPQPPLSVRTNPGRLKPRVEVSARPGRRIIDFTEE